MILELREVFQKINDTQKREDKIAILREQNRPSLKIAIDLFLNKKIKWIIPEEIPHYRPLRDVSDSMIDYQLKKIDRFIDSPSNLLDSYKANKLWLGVLETMSKEDVEFLYSIINKTLVCKGLTKGLANKAIGMFPELVADAD